MIKEITQFILTEIAPINPFWVRDVNVFVGHLPITNINSVKIDRPGQERIALFLENSVADTFHQLPDRQDKPVQIINRNASFFTARDDAYEFYDLLKSRNRCILPVVTSGIQYIAMVIEAQGTPIPLENPDAKNRYIFNNNYLFRVQTL